MLEEFVIGLLLGIISMLPIFPKKRTFWQWIFKGKGEEKKT